MTLAEIFVFILAVLIIYKIMSPLRERLEERFYKIFRPKSRKKEDVIIDITDYAKKKEPKK